MKNTFGQHLAVTLFGESHGPAIGAVLDGLCPGTPVDEENIRRMLQLRQPGGTISTPADSNHEKLREPPVVTTIAS